MSDGALNDKEIEELLIWEKDKKETLTQKRIVEICDAMKTLLLEKNKRYGDAALNPKNIFYKGTATESICTRIDDKLSRIINNKEDKPRKNDVCDLIGYLILLLISINTESKDILEMID